MAAFLPYLFIGLSGACLLGALFFTWASVRALLAADTVDLLEYSEAAHRRGELVEEKQALLRSIKDLEFEREVGKLSEEDFERLNGQFRRRAKKLMRELEADLLPYRDDARALLAGGRRGNDT